MGDYRHWIDLGGRRLSHSMDQGRGAPLADSPASVTVLAPRRNRGGCLCEGADIAGMHGQGGVGAAAGAFDALSKA
ncbi:hypothetical protein GXP64_10815 [Rhodovulum sulfidophilum]|nr:hypothetical protein [Rhodovulum sulfidophilum]